MKKIKEIFMLVLILIISAAILNKVSAVTLSTSQTPESVDSNSNFIVTLKLDKKVSAITAYVNYDSNLFTVTENENVTKYSDGVLSLSYANIGGTSDKDTFEINVTSKEVTEQKNGTFKITNIVLNTGDATDAKSLADVTLNVVVNPKTIGTNTINDTNTNSISSNEAINSNTSNSNVINTADKTISSNKLAKTGESNVIVLVIISLIAIVVALKIKSNKFKKLFIMLPVLLAITAFGAKTTKADVISGGNGEGKLLIQTEESYITVSPNNSGFYYDKNDSTKMEVLQDDLKAAFGKNIKIVQTNPDRDRLATGDEITTEDGKKYNLIIYSDVDKDGNLYAAGDYQKIIDKIIRNDILFSEKGEDSYNNQTNYYNEIKAADINLDEKINILDMQRMRNKFMGYDGHPGTDKTNNRLPEGTLIQLIQLKMSIDKKLIVKGDKAQVKVTLSKSIADKEVKFTTSTEGIVTISNISNNNGEITADVTGNTVGKVNITAKIEDLKLSGSVNCEVTENNVTGFKLSADPSTIEVGKTTTVVAEKVPENGLGEAKFSSENTAIATVDENTGVVTGVSKGTVNINVTSTTNSAIKNTLQITINNKQITGIAWANKITSVKVGSSVQETYTLEPADAEKPTITWKSSNPSVATVDENGNVKGIAVGTADITARATDVTGSYHEITIVGFSVIN